MGSLDHGLISDEECEDKADGREQDQRLDLPRHAAQEAYDEALTDKSRVRLDDVLLTKDGSLGRVAVVDKPNTCVNQSVAVLRPTPKLIPQFLAYSLNSPMMQARLMFDASGATIKHIYIIKVAKMDYPIPPLEEQERIVDRLNGAEEIKKTNAESDKKIEELKSSLLQRAFGGEL